MNLPKRIRDRLVNARSIIGLGMAALAIIITVIGYRARTSNPPTSTPFIDDFYANVAVDLAFTAVTILIIDVLDDRREQKMEKERLILQMGSPNNGTAMEAVRVLRSRGWLSDGSLNGAFLEAADLSHCNLTDSKLHGANLNQVKLNGAMMKKADLTAAMLSNAQFQDAELIDSIFDQATLYGAQLQNANLSNCSFKGANLLNANLRGAMLYGADLTDANLRNADLTDATLLNALVTPEQLKRALSTRGIIKPEDSL
jgi:hypothetical protein